MPHSSLLVDLNMQLLLIQPVNVALEIQNLSRYITCRCHLDTSTPRIQHQAVDWTSWKLPWTLKVHRPVSVHMQSGCCSLICSLYNTLPTVCPVFLIIYYRSVHFISSATINHQRVKKSALHLKRVKGPSIFQTGHRQTHDSVHTVCAGKMSAHTDSCVHG